MELRVNSLFSKKMWSIHSKKMAPCLALFSDDLPNPEAEAHIHLGTQDLVAGIDCLDPGVVIQAFLLAH